MTNQDRDKKFQEQKVSEIEQIHGIKFPKFVKDALIDAFRFQRDKRAFIKADKLRYKPAKWLYDNKVISILYVFANNKPSTYKIENMPSDWLDYEVYKKDMDKRACEIIDKTFKDGMSIFK